jgi:hypothetical protein
MRLSLFLLERFGGKFLRQTASVASCEFAVGPCMQPECDRRGWTSSGELVKPLVDADCVNEGFHGIPVPYLATCIFDGKCLPEASRNGNNLGWPWYATSFRMARGYTGVLIGRGWVACIVLGTLASQTTAKRDGNTRAAAKIHVQTVHAEAMPITAFRDGDWYLSEWMDFPWADFDGFDPPLTFATPRPPQQPQVQPQRQQQPQPQVQRQQQPPPRPRRPPPSSPTEMPERTEEAAAARVARAAAAPAAAAAVPRRVPPPPRGRAAALSAAAKSRLPAGSRSRSRGQPELQLPPAPYNIFTSTTTIQAPASAAAAAAKVRPPLLLRPRGSAASPAAAEIPFRRKPSRSIRRERQPEQQPEQQPTAAAHAVTQPPAPPAPPAPAAARSSRSEPERGDAKGGCWHPRCSFALHSNPDVCEQFCCKRCLQNFTTDPDADSNDHGKLCEGKLAGAPLAAGSSSRVRSADIAEQ